MSNERWKFGTYDTDSSVWQGLHKHGEMPVIYKGKELVAIFFGENAKENAIRAAKFTTATADTLCGVCKHTYGYHLPAGRCGFVAHIGRDRCSCGKFTEAPQESSHN